MSNIRDVANRAGLSVTTVSRVLNNRGYISAKTRKKVYQAMEELNYYPNELARSLYRQRSNFIGVIVPSVAHPFFAMLLQAIEYEAAQAGLKVLLCVSKQDTAKEIEYLRMLKGNKVDGIILSSRSSEIHAHLDQALPFVTIDRILDSSIPCVSGDNYAGGCLATEHLIRQGCRKLAHITGAPQLHLQANRRDEAFVNTCKAHQIAPIVVATDELNFDRLDYYATIRQLLTEHDIDGLFAGNDILAAQALQVAGQLGRQVPRDLKIVGFDDIPLASLTVPPVTTIRQPVAEMGKYAVDAIVRQLEGTMVPSQIILPVELVVRAST